VYATELAIPAIMRRGIIYLMLIFNI